MKKNLAPILIVAFAMAVVCTAVFYGLVAGKLGQAARANATPQVLVAGRTIARGSSVSGLDVKTAEWNGAVPEGALRRVSEADGLTTLNDLAPGEPLLASKLFNKRTGGGLGIPAGMRAISVQVQNSSGVVAILKPGHHVDVQAVYTRTGSNQDAEIRTVLENVEVLKIDATVEPGPGRPPFPVATLLVTPQEADTVGLADAVARVRLVLRNPLDSERFTRTTIGVTGMMKSGGGAGIATQPTPYRNASAVPVATNNSMPRPSGLSLPAASPAACDPPKAAAPSSPSH